MIIWPLISLFGLLFVDRTIADAESLRLFSQSATNIVRITSFTAVIFLNWMLKEHLLTLWLITFAVFLTPMIAVRLIRGHRETHLRSEFIPVLDNLALSMRAGKGFRQALQNCLGTREIRSQWAFQEFVSSLEYQKSMIEFSKDRQIQLFFQELGQIDQTSHKQIERVKALRQRLNIEKNLRQKSRQAMMQVKFQSTVISLMFGGLLIFVHFQFGIKQHLQLISASTGCFLLGLLWIHNIGRGYKWKL